MRDSKIYIQKGLLYGITLAMVILVMLITENYDKIKDALIVFPISFTIDVSLCLFISKKIKH